MCNSGHKKLVFLSPLTTIQFFSARRSHGVVRGHDSGTLCGFDDVKLANNVRKNIDFYKFPLGLHDFKKLSNCIYLD